MGKNIASDVKWCVHFARENAQYFYSIGKLTQAGAEDWMRVEALVRARMLKKGAQWPPEKIQRKVRARLAMRKIWALGKSQPWRPFGGAIASVGESFEKLAASLQKDVEEELKRGQE